MALYLPCSNKPAGACLAGMLSTWLAVGLVPPRDTLAATCTGDVDKAAKAFDIARSSIEAGKLDQAKGELERVLKLLPCHPDAHLELGHIALKDGRFEEALHLYEAAVGDYAAGADLVRQAQSKRYMESRKQLSDLRIQVMRMKSGSNQDVRSSATNDAVQISVLEEQIRSLESMQAPADTGAIEPPGEVYFHIGNALLRLQRGDEALRNFETCREKSPKFGPVHVNLAVMYWRRGRFDDARVALAKAEELKAPVNPKFKADLQRDIETKGGSGGK